MSNIVIYNHSLFFLAGRHSVPCGEVSEMLAVTPGRRVISLLFVATALTLSSEPRVVSGQANIKGKKSLALLNFAFKMIISAQYLWREAMICCR